MAASSSALQQQLPTPPDRAGRPEVFRPRVCFVGMSSLAVLAREYNRFGIGGEQVQHTLLAKALARRGYRVSMVTADYGQPDGATWDAVKTYKAFAFDAGLPVLRFLHPRWSGLWSALKRADADVYYTSCAGVIVGQLALFCRRHGRRLIYRVASDTDCEPDNLLIPYWRDKKLYEYGLRRAHGVLAQSLYQQRALQKNYGVHSAVAGMLVDTQHTELAYGQRAATALWVSNFRALKRPGMLFEVADALPGLSFHMVGGPVSGHEGVFAEAQQRAAARSNVVFHGQVPYHDVHAQYERARVFVNTSEIEGFPNSYLQAWARGTPVVATFDPDGVIAREGLGVAVSSRAEMIAAIASLVGNEMSWTAASNRCKAFIAREYGEDAVLAPYERLIASLAGGSSP